MKNKKQEILEIAEKMVRSGGYNSFSFREIASKIKIKSSSIHYYFPTKADLVASLVEYYTEKFFSHLDTPEEIISRNQNPMDSYIRIFRNAVKKDQLMCLCGILGTEITTIPTKVSDKVKQFFNLNLLWLEKHYTLLGINEPKQKAIQAFSILEGAIIVSNVFKDTSKFDLALDLIPKL